MVKLLYSDEHLSCPAYDSEEYPVIEEITMAAGYISQWQARVNKLVFVLDGQIEYSTGQVFRQSVRKGHIFFLASTRQVWCKAVEDAVLLIIRFYGKIRFCDCLSVEDLYKVSEMERKEVKGKLRNEDAILLETNPVMDKYLDMLHTCYGAGLRCRYYNENKLKELMYIFRAFYPKEKLRDLFAPVLSADTCFAQQFIETYNQYGNLSETASAMNYTLSGFEKKFRKVFGCSPYGWILHQKAQEIMHYVKTSNLNLSEIADRYGFSSASAFNNFFKKRYGITPGQARQNKGGINK